MDVANKVGIADTLLDVIGITADDINTILETGNEE